jgi:S1-C subfamily serine protease/tetratricopeptide (TPR) repeat protein
MQAIWRFHRRDARFIAIALAGMFIFLASPRLRAQADVRDKYGTRKLDVAEHIDAAIKLAQAKKPDAAAKEVDAAVAGDPACAMAWLWKAIVCNDLGDIDQCIEAYKKCAALDVEPHNQEVTTTAKTNLGLLMGQLKRYDESAYWFGRSIVDDSDDHAKEQAKAYRNLAITFHYQGKEFAAALAAITGHDIDPDRIEEGMIREFFGKAEGMESARVLALEQDLPHLTARPEPGKLREIKADGTGTDRIEQVLADPRGKFVVAFAGLWNKVGADHYYAMELKPGADPQVRKVAAPGPITTACLAGERLFAVTSKPVKLHELDPLTGKSLHVWDIGETAPASIAVLPSKNAAFLAVKDEIMRMDLAGGRINDTEMPGQVLVADPSEKYIYARYKDPPENNNRTVMVDGQPIFIETDHFDWEQTTLLKLYVAPSKLLPAAIRLNASSNGYDVVVSPDGQFVSVPGGGGWRPNAGNGGYKIAVFDTADFDKVQGAFDIDAYPVGCAFNAVTHQVAGLRNGDAKIYDLAGDVSKPEETLKGSFGKACAWSGDGRYLVTGRNGPGLNVYENTLTPVEQKTAAGWWKTVLPADRKGALGGAVAGGTAAGRPTSRPADQQLAGFVPATDRATVARSVAAALASKSTDRPLAWKDLPAYTANAASMATLSDVAAPDIETGVRIYQLKKAMEKDPQSVPLKYYSAKSLRDGGQTELARARFLEVIHADAGRTELTALSLGWLYGMFAQEGKDLPEADCLAHAVALDRGNRAPAERLVPLLQKLNFPDEAKRLSVAMPAGSASVAGMGVPTLPAAPEGAALTPAKLYQQAAPSVVLIRCADSSGTGVCVGKAGTILTSRHVIAGASHIDVFPFSVENGRAKRLGKLSASVVAESEKDDLAVLRLDDAPPAAMMPLPVADKTPGVGEKVFAIGNPGLGRQTLDLSFSEGIVSSSSRVIRCETYLQHTAAINPGNSGGPLLDESGRVVAVVCLKADLSGVSFATPAEVIRAFFAAHAQTPQERDGEAK